MKKRLLASLSLAFVMLLSLAGVGVTYFSYLGSDYSQTEAAITSSELRTAQTKLKRWDF